MQPEVVALKGPVACRRKQDDSDPGELLRCGLRTKPKCILIYAKEWHPVCALLWGRHDPELLMGYKFV